MSKTPHNHDRFSGGALAHVGTLSSSTFSTQQTQKKSCPWVKKPTLMAWLVIHRLWMIYGYASMSQESANECFCWGDQHLLRLERLPCTTDHSQRWFASGRRSSKARPGDKEVKIHARLYQCGLGKWLHHTGTSSPGRVGTHDFLVAKGMWYKLGTQEN